jgi:hypothetical protein
MAEKTYLVRLKPPNRALQQVTAARFEKTDDHLVFVDEKGKAGSHLLVGAG